MSDDTSGRDRRAAWRGGRNSRGGARRHTESAGRWQRRVRPSGGDYRGDRRWLFAQRLGLTLGVVGLLVGMVLLFGPKPAVPLIVAIVSDYERPLGPLPLAAQDRGEFGKLLKGRAGLGRTTVRPVDVSARLAKADSEEFRDTVVEAVANTRGGGPGGGTAVVYVSCIGAVDRDGRACLVPSRVAPGRLQDIDRSWLRVTDLLKALAERRTRPRFLVIVLDACRSAHGESLGILDGGFAAAVATDVGSVPTAGISVIVSAGPGETACAALPETASVFAGAFIDAVEGCGDTDGDGRVTFRELATYLTDEVSRRARQRHGRVQTPFAVPNAEARTGVSWRVRRTPLAWGTDSAASPGAMPPGSVPAGDDWLAERWTKAEQLRSQGVTVRPVQWAAFEQLLIRAERQLAAGNQVDPTVLKDLEEVEPRLAEPVTTRGVVLPGLRLSRLAGIPTAAIEPGFQGALDAWAAGLAGGGSPAAAELAGGGSPAAAELAGGGSPAAAGGGKPPGVPPPPRDEAEWIQRIEVGWRKAVDLADKGTAIDRGSWQRLFGFIGVPPASGERPPWPIEVQAARVLAAESDIDIDMRAASVLALSEAAAQAAVADDPRAEPLVAAMWPRGAIDRMRRQAYDLSAIGDEASSARAAALVADAGRGYRDIIQTAEEVSGHWRLVDRIRSELPWLAAWRVAQAAIAADRPRRDAADTIDWTALLAAAEMLERQLAVEPAGRGEDVVVALKKAAREAGSFLGIRDSYDLACETLADRSAGDATTLAEIRTVLAIPLVTGDLRARLRERAGELAVEFAGADHVAASAARPSSLSSDSSSASLAAIRGMWVPWRDGRVVDPFVAAVVSSTEGVREPESLADVAQAYAVWGRQLRDAIDAVAHGNPAAGPLAAAAVAERRGAVVHGALKSAAWTASAATEQMRFHWRDRLVAAAGGAIEEFFARAGQGERDWHLLAAHKCLDEAAKLAGSGRDDPRLEQIAQRVRQRLTALETSGSAWCRLVNDPDRLGGSAPVTSALEMDAELEQVAAAPVGDAALWLSTGRAEAVLLSPLTEAGVGSGAAVRRVPLSVSRPGSRTRWRIAEKSAEQLRAGDRGTVDLIAWFRGHRIESAMPVVTDGGGVPVVWRRRTLDEPRITVAGRDTQTGYVTFIVDCSGSMTKVRMNQAKDALRAILDSLAESRAWEASVWLYGHRSAWTQTEPYDIEPSDLGKRRTRESLPHPAEDVEQIQSMALVTPDRARDVRALLDQTAGWGETPLYLSLCAAIARDGARVPDGSVWRMILLTDGVNKTAAFEPHPRPDSRSAQDVTDAVKLVNKGRRSPLAIDVIALDLKPTAADRDEYEKLRTLVKDANGQWRDASDLDNLKKAFREFLGLERWEVADASGQTIGVAELGGVLPARLTPGRYAVRLERRPSTETTVELEGGEIIELFAAGRDRPLEHRRYDGGGEQGIRDTQADLEDPGDSTRRWFVAAHLPRREGGSRVRFPVSLQHDDERRFSPRPMEVWAEVRPHGVSDARPFVFWDVDLEPSRPVPVIDLDVTAWPREADRAEILVWFSPTRIDATDMAVRGEVVPLDTIAFDETRRLEFPDRLPGVAFELTLTRIDDSLGALRVVEKHSDPRDLPRLRVRVEPAPHRAEHEVDAATGAVRHEFELPLERGRVAERTTLDILHRDDLKQRCVQPRVVGGRHQALLVPLPERD